MKIAIETAKRFLKPLVGMGVLLCISCNVTPEYTAPEFDFDVPVTFDQSHAETESIPALDPWWRDFGDEKLNRLVEQVLQNNPDIKQAAARILETRAQYRQTRADQWPELTLDGGYSKRKIGGARVGGGNRFETYELAVPASFEIDLWGRLASSSRAAWNELLSAEANRDTVAQGITAEAVRLYLEIEASERRIQIVEQSIESFRRSLAFVNTRYKRGLISILDVRQARRALAGAEARLPGLHQSLGEAQQQLAILAGSYPHTSPAREQPEGYFRMLAPVPSGLPSELLQRRPDIRSAEARLKAFHARVGVARAARFPSIRLTGTYGYSSDQLGELIKSGNDFWDITGGITQPLFDAGRLKAAQQAAEARYQAETAVFTQAVLNAFAEVETALLTRQKQYERRVGLVRFVEEARATQRVAQNRYMRGLVDYLEVLNAQQTRYQAEERVVDVDLAIWSNRVRLHRALGGGWATTPPTTSSSLGRLKTSP